MENMLEMDGIMYDMDNMKDCIRFWKAIGLDHKVAKKTAVRCKKAEIRICNREKGANNEN